jgi:hypothetical protein
MKASGLFVGMGAVAMRIGVGFQPRKVRIVQVGTANLITLDWTREMARSATGAGGIVRAGVANTPGFVLLAANAGVRQYAGGDVIATSSLADQIAASSVSAYMGTLQGTITTWTNGSTANRTGNFNADLAATCGVGSLVDIRASDEKVYRAAIVALTNHGSAANEVTLDRAVPSGKVIFVGCATDFVAAPVGKIMPAGFEVQDVTYGNVASTVFAFECED